MAMDGQGSPRATPWSRLDRVLVRLAAGRIGPVRLAVILAIASLPVVLFGLPAYVPGPSPYSDISELKRLSPLSPEVLAAEVPAVLIASVVAGSIGGWVARRDLVPGAVLTCVLAWIVGIAVLPIGPALLGLRYGTAHVALAGATGTLEIRATDGPMGFMGVGLLVSPFVALAPFVALVIGVIVWARTIRAADATVDRATPPEPSAVLRA